MSADEEVEEVDLLAALQRSIDRHKATVSQAQAAQEPRSAPPEGDSASPGNPKAQKRAETIARRRAATGFRVGDRVRTTTPKTPRFHAREGKVTGINLGEVGVSFTGGAAVDAWFKPAELDRVSVR